jgi:hypothetical protein
MKIKARGGSRDSVDGGLSYGAIFSIIDGTNLHARTALGLQLVPSIIENIAP